MKNKISNQLLKGFLQPVVMNLLKENDRMYGYEITRKVEELSQGKLSLTYAALYPLLHRLENDGIVITESENVNNRIRVYYKLTEKGHRKTAEKIRELQEFIQTINTLLKPKVSLGICSI
jgi:PadR family transcriptional regulator, regulatory protein PadR